MPEGGKDGEGVLGGRIVITRPPEQPHGMGAVALDLRNMPDDIFLEVEADGGVVGYCGHVDLGTGIRTALSQIIAEEMDVPFASVRMELGHTATTPNQGATIASETIQVSAIPLRMAAAHARVSLLTIAADRAGVAREALDLADGVVTHRVDGQDVHLFTIAELVRGFDRTFRLDENVPLKSREQYRVVGREVPRVDIPDKVTGRAVYVHDVRIPGMLHGRVIRPPYHGFEHGKAVGRSLIAVDRHSVSHLPGFVELVVAGDFVGVVAEREEQAIAAASALVIRWEQVSFPDLTDVEAALRRNPSTPRRLLDCGDTDVALAAVSRRLEATYSWPYQMHASIGPSCAVADWKDDGVTVWSGTQNPHMLRAHLGLLADIPENCVEIIRHEAAGCYGRNCADDVCGDALLLSRAVGRPVRVQLSREQEHLWEPKGAAQLIDISGGLDADGAPAAYSFQTCYPSNVSPLLALVLTRRIDADVPATTQMGDRTCLPPYAYRNARVVVHDMPPIARASWLRGVSAMPNSFAHDSYIDELAVLAGCDPLEYRLRILPDQRACTMLRALAERAGWGTRSAGGRLGDRSARVLKGAGVAYAQYIHGAFPGSQAAWAAWIVTVAVDRLTGRISILRVHVAQDAGMMINPAGVRHQVHGNVLQSISRVLKEEVSFDRGGVTSRDWGTYPILTFPEVPDIDILFMDRPDDPPLGVGESASVPSAAAIANAVFDATGVRFRTLPLTPDKVKAALDAELGVYRSEVTDVAYAPSPEPQPAAQPMTQARPGGKRPWSKWVEVGAIMAAVTQVATTASPLRPPIAPITRPDSLRFAPELIERGRILAAAGDCAVCHTAPGGIANAGGRALETPFGVVRSTNLTPDVETGLGGWSYDAFKRAMREGISRDGHHLYPAFPYTSFAKTSDADLRAIYAFLMSQTAIRNPVPESALSFPYNIRSMMAGWNLLFHDPEPYRPDPAQSAVWNRGAYLVDGLGHCSACHTPRNALGAEKSGARYLAGGEADGWIAPGLGRFSNAPLRWSEDAMFTYLRTGYSSEHGPSAGPMAPVIEEMHHLPDDDVRAIAVYLTSLKVPSSQDAEATQIRTVGAERASRLSVDAEGGRIFAGSCAACHVGDAAHVAGNRPELALNSNIFDERPDNLIQIVLHGMDYTGVTGRGEMPAFGATLDDAQIAALLRYLRGVYAPEKPVWVGLEKTIERIRALEPHRP